jgi:hypothetical protein
LADPDEEYITQRFFEELKHALDRASSSGQVETAFLQDLKASFPSRMYSAKLPEIARGIIAEVTRHNRATEGKTGGDLGLVVVRPQMHITQTASEPTLHIRDYKRGLLCQAKLLATRHAHFSKKQRLLLPDRTSYLALLLYAFADDGITLADFEWQICGGYEFSSIESWLKTAKFPSLQTSGEVIYALGSGSAGTDDVAIIDGEISPAKNPALVLKIGWREGEGPKSDVKLIRAAERQTHITQTQAIVVRA